MRKRESTIAKPTADLIEELWVVEKQEVQRWNRAFRPHHNVSVAGLRIAAHREIAMQHVFFLIDPVAPLLRLAET